MRTTDYVNHFPSKEGTMKLYENCTLKYTSENPRLIKHRQIFWVQPTLSCLKNNNRTVKSKLFKFIQPNNFIFFVNPDMCMVPLTVPSMSIISSKLSDPSSQRHTGIT